MNKQWITRIKLYKPTVGPSFKPAIMTPPPTQHRKAETEERRRDCLSPKHPTDDLSIEIEMFRRDSQSPLSISYNFYCNFWSIELNDFIFSLVWVYVTRSIEWNLVVYWVNFNKKKAGDYKMCANPDPRICVGDVRGEGGHYLIGAETM